ncbi:MULTISPECIES: RAD55 family ATPase [Salinibaculum]|uniref:RAD55 family ATPase n=1 Tax=Salinibaculum TaxID=2732368 RepID=UPI0030D4F9CD
MSANSRAEERRAEEGVALRDVFPPGPDAASVLVQGPAMVGKQEIGVELLSTASSGGGQPIAVTTADTAGQLRSAFREAGGNETDRVLVVDCLPVDSGSTDEWTRSVESPSDLTGIAMAVSGALENIPESRRRGSRLLVDNVATMLMYAEIEPVYRFLHALVQRIEKVGGAVVATLDTDGIERSENRALVGLFDAVVEVRRSESTTEVRIEGREEAPDGWHRYDGPGGVEP